MTKRIFITGGAGFLGSVFVERLLALPNISKISVFDRHALDKDRSRLANNDDRIALIKGDVKDLAALTESMAGHDTVIHLASNADISLSVNQPTIDFEAGTILTQNTLEAARLNKVTRVLYASGSGVYGESGARELREEDGPLTPISTYGASKLAGEALLSAYCHMFDLTGIAFRFANIVGAAQTHGVAFDFVEKLKSNPHHLQILGDGTQTKSYIDADDVFEAVWLAHCRSTKNFDVFNVASGDVISVKNIAAIAIEESLGPKARVELQYGSTDRGWKGDVPVVKLNTDKIRALGFSPKLNSSEAIRRAVKGMVSLSRPGVAK